MAYYISDRDGFLCIWANRLDPVGKKPLGDPIPVVQFHAGRNSLDDVYGQELSVASDKLVFSLGESSGNVWLAPATRPPKHLRPVAVSQTQQCAGLHIFDRGPSELLHIESLRRTEYSNERLCNHHSEQCL